MTKYSIGWLTIDKNGKYEYDPLFFDTFDEAFEAARITADKMAAKMNCSVYERYPSDPKSYADSIGAVELFQIIDGSSALRVVFVKGHKK